MSVPMQNIKLVNLTPPGALVDDASLSVLELDTLGWDYVTIVLMLGATDIGVTVCKLTDADVSATSHADITGTVYGTATDIDGTLSILPASDDDDGFFGWELDLKKRKRFIDAVITVDDGTVGGYYAVFAILSRGQQPPITVSARGFDGLVRV